MVEQYKRLQLIHQSCAFPDISSGIFFNTFSSGMEIASYLIDKASSITVVGSSELPYQSTLGPEIGRVTMMVRRRN